MLAFLKATPEVKTVLVEKTDRLYRNFKDYVDLEEYDLEVHLVKEGSIISKNSKSHDKFIHGIKVLMAKNYIDNLSEEIKKGLREGLEQGFWPFQPPYGYLRGIEKALYIDKRHVMFVRRAFQLFGTGNYSLSRLADTLFNEGYYYKADRPKITKCVLEGMLKNRIYTGQMVCNDIIYNGKHPAIISIDEFNKAQIAFRKTDKSKVRKNFHFLYPGIAKCAVCGYSICGEVKKHHKMIYYRCSHYDRTCGNSSYISEKELTTAFRRHLKRIALNEELYSLLKTCLQECFKYEEKFHKEETYRLNKEIADCTNTLKKIYVDQLEGSLERYLWISIKNDYEVKLNQLHADLQRHQGANTNYMDTSIKILDICHKANLNASQLPPEELAKIVRESYSSVTVEGKHVKMKFAEPFATIEKLARIAKQGISEFGCEKFAETLLAHDSAPNKATKKSLDGSFESVSHSVVCMNWWA